MSTFAVIVTFIRNVMNHVVILCLLFLLKLSTEVEELGENAIVILNLHENNKKNKNSINQPFIYQHCS